MTWSPRNRCEEDDDDDAEEKSNLSNNRDSDSPAGAKGEGMQW